MSPQLVVRRELGIPRGSSGLFDPFDNISHQDRHGSVGAETKENVNDIKGVSDGSGENEM